MVSANFINFFVLVKKQLINFQILMYPVVAIMALLGGGSSIVVVAYLFIVLAQKIKNKIKYGASMYD